MDPFYAVDSFVTLQPGQPFRLLPIGRLVKGGKVRDLTRELLAKFKLPHFRPAIKLGSHADEAHAGGHLVGLEVRDDGLYGIPELTEEGIAAWERGDYRYHSPEIVWDGGYEDPATGEMISGPMIVGVALLHVPHLGEAAALYHAEALEDNMTMQNEGTVPVGVLDRFLEAIRGAQPPQPQEPQQAPVMQTAIEVQTFEAEFQQAQAEIERLQAEMESLTAEKQKADRLAALRAELGDGVTADVYTALVALPEEVAAPLVTQYKALIAQAGQSDLTRDVGDGGEEYAGSAAGRYQAAVDQYMAAHNVTREHAALAVVREHPELLED